MSTHVICAGDHRRILDFLHSYHPSNHTEATQIELLQKKLETAEIVPENELSRFVVSMYSAVRIANLREREMRNYTLVYPYNAQSSVGSISLLSPLGTALLGCRQGEKVICSHEAGTTEFAIRELLYQPEWDERNRFPAARLASHH